jgi:ABC-type nitrate/sulfonate/bicarbonate transport system substrate-binding protein
MKKLSLIAAALLLLPAAARAESTIGMTSFGGITNLPFWVAQDKGYFKGQGLTVLFAQTRSSTDQMRDMMADKYQIASTSLDNVIAYTEGQSDVPIPGYDVVAFLGGNAGQNQVVTRPEIKTYQDIKSHAVVVDAKGSGYAFVLYQLLENNGLTRDKDYSIVAVGGGPARYQAMQDGKGVAAILGAPNDIEAERLGYHLLGDAAGALGASQGAYAARRGWLKAHEAEAVGFARAMKQAHAFVFANKADSIALLRAHMKALTPEQAEGFYKTMVEKGALNRTPEVKREGLINMLKLREKYAEPKKRLDNPDKYLDVSYYKKAAQ